MHAHEIQVADDEGGERLDRWLVRRLTDASRARVRRLIEEGKVHVDGRRAKKGARTVAGQRVTLDELPAPVSFDPAPRPDLALPILYADAQLVVADKPAGMPTHPLRPEDSDTACNALVALYPEMIGVGHARREPGIVHRLDTDTSGALLAARDATVFEALRDELAAGRIDKTYVALCAGDVSAPMTIDAPLASDPRDRRRVAASPGGRSGRTEVLSSERVGGLSLVRVRAPRAGRHQVRAHLAHLGHALAGDVLYGGPAIHGLERHFLHAASMALAHPATGRDLVVESPLPPDLAGVVEALCS